VTDLLSSLAELLDDLVAAYAEGAESLPCACGGIVVARRHDPTPGVRLHQRTRQHRRWWTQRRTKRWDDVQRTRDWKRRLASDVARVRAARA